jgi:hypothetical protein
MLSLDPLKSAKFYTLSNSYEGIIESHHLLLYVLTDGKNVKFGEIHGSGVGKTPEQAVTDSYNNKRNQFENHYILAFIVIDKKEHKEKGL